MNVKLSAVTPASSKASAPTSNTLPTFSKKLSPVILPAFISDAKSNPPVNAIETVTGLCHDFDEGSN